MERRDPKPPTLAKVVATLMTFRRLLVIWGIVPLIVAASPFVAGLYLVVVNFVTSGSGFLSTLVAIGVTLIGRHAITTYAPSPKQCDDAFSDSRILLPLAGFVCSRVIISSILSPIANWLGFHSVILFSPKPPYTSSLLLAACMLLLGAAVLIRFIGPVSVGKNACRLIFVPVGKRTFTHSFLAREVLVCAFKIRPSLVFDAILLGAIHFVWSFFGACRISEPSFWRGTHQVERGRVSLFLAVHTSYGRTNSFLFTDRIHITSFSTYGASLFSFRSARQGGVERDLRICNLDQLGVFVPLWKLA
jgi:hypothetical protein